MYLIQIGSHQTKIRNGLFVIRIGPEKFQLKNLYAAKRHTKFFSP